MLGHANVSKILPLILQQFDSVVLYDTNSAQPKLVMGSPPMTIHDAAAWKQFVDKANLLQKG